MRSTEQSYGGMAKVIHWASAVLIIILIGSGFRSGFATDPEAKLAALRVHLPVAGLVLILTIARLVWWARFDTRPQPLPGQPGWQEAVARWTHRALYALIIVLLVSGIAMSVMAGLPDAVFGAAEMPELADLPPRMGHGLAARLIAAAFLLHAGAALYHHWVKKDGTLRRMWFSK